MSRVVILGPQRLQPTLGQVVGDLNLREPFFSVTAGWQEREGEIEEMHRDLGRPLSDLALYARAEWAFERDAELFAAYRERQSTLRQMQRLYRMRLSLAMRAARQLFHFGGPRKLVARERRAAVGAVRTLDREHLKRIIGVHEEFEARWQPLSRPALQSQHKEISELLEKCSTLLIAGGHVAVLLNRLRLFGLQDWLRQKDVVAWSAGAMALSERVVLFHDFPPQGAGDAEVLEAGLGIVKGWIPLPHAKRRLRLRDRRRVALMARRFGPGKAVALDEGSLIVCDDDVCRGLSACRLLASSGRLETGCRL